MRWSSFMRQMWLTSRLDLNGAGEPVVIKVRNVRSVFLCVLCALLFNGFAFAAAQSDDVRTHPYEVYLERGIDDTGRDRLIFIDLLTGAQTTLEVYGERYTPVGQAVMFSEVFTSRVLLATPDGAVREHPFIQPGAQTSRIDWVLSVDGKRIAWTLVSGAQAALTTITTVANIDGTNPLQALADGPRAGFRAMPLAFNAENTLLYMDMHPDGLDAFTPFSQYREIFVLDLTNGVTTNLPAEPPGCYCGAGVGAGWFVRLTVDAELQGFDVRLHDLRAQTETTLPALTFNGFTQAGDVLISPDGTRAVYALAQVEDFGGRRQSVLTHFILINLQDGTQSQLVGPLEIYLRPKAWTEDNSAILFTSPDQDGTWKVNLNERRLRRVADATYVGVIK